MTIRPRFSLRLLLSIITALSLLFGWKTNREHEREKAIAALSEAGAQVIVEDSVPIWAKRFLGQHTGEYVRGVRMCAPNRMTGSVSRGIGGEIGVTLTPSESMSDDEVYALYAQPPGAAGLVRRQIATPDLSHLARCDDCHFLDLSQSEVTDGELAHLGRLGRLEWLILNDTAITNTGLALLHDLKSLRHIYLDGTQVTPAGMAALVRAIPGVEIGLNRTDEEPTR